MSQASPSFPFRAGDRAAIESIAIEGRTKEKTPIENGSDKKAASRGKDCAEEGRREVRPACGRFRAHPRRGMLTGNWLNRLAIAVREIKKPIAERRRRLRAGSVHSLRHDFPGSLSHTHCKKKRERERERKREVSMCS